jgi:hypothetical protein
MEPPVTSKKKKASTSTEPDVEYAVRNDMLDNLLLKNFNVFFEFDKMGEFEDAEYMSKIEIATEVKNRIEFEFFQDVNGNWVFKPPFYNMNTKYVLPYRIEPHDVINSSFQIDSEAIITVLEITTPLHGNLRDPSLPSGVGFHMDIELAKRYGVRYQSMHVEYLRTRRAANLIAMGRMSRMNSKAFTGSVTIPGRPEIRLGYPIYMVHRDSFHYVKSINHAFDYGGSFTTTLSFEAERKRLYEYNKDNNNQWSKDPWYDQVYLYNPKKTASLDITQSPIELVAQSNEERELMSKAGMISTSFKQGRYDFASRGDAAKQLGIDPDALRSVSSNTVPLTDEEGYQVIGGFRYGRGIPVGSGTVIAEAKTNEAGDLATAGIDPTERDRLDAITTMSASDESKHMDSFFDTFKKGEEGIIPGYLTTFDIQLQEDNALGEVVENTVQTISSMVPDGVGRNSDQELVNQQVAD